MTTTELYTDTNSDGDVDLEDVMVVIDADKDGVVDLQEMYVGWSEVG